VILFLIALHIWAVGAAAKQPQAGAFDYFVLALSWSPTYCSTNAGQNDNSQCAPGRRFAFVVLGLWPQYQLGWPQNCATE
jgi:ribonuclease T2